jgi:hypothetical protein
MPAASSLISITCRRRQSSFAKARRERGARAEIVARNRTGDYRPAFPGIAE